MKKLLSVCLILLMLIAIPCEAFAETPDLSALSNDELRTLIDRARNELASRELRAGGNTLLFDQAGVQVHLTGNNSVVDFGGYQYFQLEVVVVNNTATDISIVENGVSMNGMKVSFFGVGGVPAGKRAKDSFKFLLSDAGLSGMDGIEDIELSLTVLSDEFHDDGHMDTVCSVGPVTVFFK